MDPDRHDRNYHESHEGPMPFGIDAVAARKFGRGTVFDLTGLSDERQGRVEGVGRAGCVDEGSA